MKLRVCLVIIIGLLSINLICPGAALAKTLDNQIVNDVSWPNCRAKQTNLSVFGVIGVSGGLDFRDNPCLAKEATWFNHYALYINTGYPGNSGALRFQNSPRSCLATDSLCLAYNYGYAAAASAISYANSQLVSSSSWWLDVETDNSWAANYALNRYDLQGALAAIGQLTFLSSVGVYSSTYQWDSLTGSWINYLPAWVASGSASKFTAVSYCDGHSFTGGQIWLSQYTTKLDDNLICTPAFPNSLSKLPSH